MTINLPPELETALILYCQDNDISISQAVSEMLENYLAANASLFVVKSL